MREIRLSGSAGGETGLTGLPYPDQYYSEPENLLPGAYGDCGQGGDDGLRLAGSAVRTVWDAPYDCDPAETVRPT